MNKQEMKQLIKDTNALAFNLYDKEEAREHFTNQFSEKNLNYLFGIKRKRVADINGIRYIKLKHIFWDSDRMAIINMAIEEWERDNTYERDDETRLFGQE